MKSRGEILTAHYAKLAKKFATWSGLVAIVLASLGVAAPAEAAQITSRKVTLSSSSPASSNATTTYVFSFVLPSATTVLSFSAAACTTALSTCTTPTGFSQSSSTVSAPTNIGSGGTWTVSTATAGELRMANASNTGSPSGTTTVTFNNVQNPTTTNQTFFMRVTTFSASNYTGAIDTGTVAASTATQLVVSADVAESLTFCVGTTWTTDCSDISGSSRTLSPNPLTTSSISTGTSELGASTNGLTGFVITYLAPDFACTAPCSHSFTNNFGSGGSASSPGTEEFGLKAAQISGTGGAVAAPYNGTNYAWNPTVTTNIANSAGGPVNLNRFTVTYGANVSTTTPYGSYTTTFNYVCTPTF
jgi:hypothetical protein